MLWLRLCNWHRLRDRGAAVATRNIANSLRSSCRPVVPVEDLGNDRIGHLPGLIVPGAAQEPIRQK